MYYRTATRTHKASARFAFTLSLSHALFCARGASFCEVNMHNEMDSKHIQRGGVSSFALSLSHAFVCAARVSVGLTVHVGALDEPN